MAVTRRRGGNMASTSNNPTRSTKLGKITNPSTVARPYKPAALRPSISQLPRPRTSSSALSQPSTELSCPTVTSSTTDRTSEGYSATIPDVNLPEKARVSTEQVMVALQKLITPGTSHNPIVLTENSPPPNNQVKTGHCMKIKAQMFQEKHSKSYTFESPYAALGPEYATGSTFTGHQSHDLYRMHTAKMAQPDRYLSKAPSSQRDILFEVQYPMSAQYLAPQQSAVYPRPDVRFYAPHSSTYRRLPTEEELRSKAVQYVRDYPRSSPRKRKMAEDLDETSESGSEDININTTRSFPDSGPAHSFTSARKTKEEPFANFLIPYTQLTRLVEHASLLTSLLRVYPQSTDQTGLRKDIAMLVSVQNQHVADWMKFENDRSKKQANPHTPCARRSTTISPLKPLASRLTEQERARAEKRRREDDEIRGLLSADAKLWQDGSGLGVADVYTENRDSTPPAGYDEESMDNVAAAIVSASSPVRCTAEAPSAAPEQGTSLASPAAETRRSNVLNPPSEHSMSGSSQGMRYDVERLVTPPPRVARTISLPAVRASGRKRQAPARFRTE